MCRSVRSVLVLLLALLPEAALALAGEITHLAGTVVARRADGQSRILSVKSQVNEGDLLVSAQNSFFRVKFTDGGEVVLRGGTQFRIDAYRYEENDPGGDSFVVSLLKGGMRSVTGLLTRRNPGKASYVTKTATIGIRGTHFGALLCDNDCANVLSPSGGPPANGLHVDVVDGRIVVTSQAGEREFTVGTFGFVASPAVLPVLVPPERGIRASLPSQAAVASLRSGTVGRAAELECRI